MDGMYAGFAGAKTGHGPVALFGCFGLIIFPSEPSAAFGRRHIDTVFAVWTVRRPGKDSMKPCQSLPRT